MNSGIKVISLAMTMMASLALAPAAQAGKKHGSVHWAKVTDYEPITRTVEVKTPVQRCWNEQVRHESRGRYHNDSMTSTIVGGIIGGALGNAVGHKKKNKKIGVAVGSILGASIGHDIGTRNGRHTPSSGSYHSSYTTERRCETEHTTVYEEEVVGYKVWYRYHGETYKTRMNHKPDNKIRVKVSVLPFH